MKKHFSIIIAIFTAIIIIFAGSYIYILYAPNAQLEHGEAKVVIVKKGMDVYDISQHFKNIELIRSPFTFVIAAKLLGISDELKAGKYTFKDVNNNHDILKMLRDGKANNIRVTIPEGLQSRQIVHIFTQKLSVDSTKLVHLIHDSSFAHSLGVPAPSLEGFLFPDTYYFYWKQDEKFILKHLVNHFFETIPDTFMKGIEKIDMTLTEAVTLASLIQGEAMVEKEMPVISGVYHNRLKKGMLLQADPTLQFIISDGPRRLTNADKEIDSPYNTYLYRGLPPGPINNPGLKAIQAAIYPDRVPYLYFVATGDSTHAFSRTMQEHLRAKRKIDKIRREYYRSKQSRQEDEES